MRTKKGLFAGVLAAAASAVAFVAVQSPVSAEQMGLSQDAQKAKVGSPAPDFVLKDTTGKEHTLSGYTSEGKIVVLEWTNPNCPYVKRHYEKYTTMKDTAAAYKDKVVWLAVNSTNPKHKDFGAEKEAIKQWGIEYPVLIDSDGKVGKMYEAKTTPHMYVINSEGILVYAGAIDNDAQDKLEADKKVNYVKQAIEELLKGETVSQPETKPYGCGVKYAS